MNREEFEKYLESIGGLENGYYTDRPPIKSSGFFEINKGWYDIVKNLIEELIAAGWDKQICQVKEKFGGLRFYTNSMSDECHKIVSKYENLSMETCEVCGEKGEPRGGGWITTLCTSHYIEPVFNKFETKHKEGFTQSEMEELLKKFPKINMDKFNGAMFGNTCMTIDEEMITYHCDVRSALYCGVENRDQRIGEWD